MSLDSSADFFASALFDSFKFSYALVLSSALGSFASCEAGTIFFSFLLTPPASPPSREESEVLRDNANQKMSSPGPGQLSLSLFCSISLC
mmetsp:Transcript_36971/g.92863  ORF Transcript_36971/g.92863 Transcript_36971/m.92863 type:complete len:90 (-) Transcript_36971:894-1163(-)